MKTQYMVQNNTRSISKPTFLSKFFSNIRSIEILNGQFIVTNRHNNKSTYDLNDFYSFPDVKPSLLGFTSNFEIIYNDELLTFTFLDNNSLLDFVDEFDKYAVINITKHLENLLGLFKELAENQYLRDSDIDVLNKRITPFRELYKRQHDIFEDNFDTDKIEQIENLISLFPINIDKAQIIRERYEEAILGKRGAFFDVIESNPLTLQQRLAVIRNNDINMVLAAAGTGKTSVMIAKALDLIDSKAASNGEDILVLAYNRAAAKELSERLDKRAEAANLTLESKPNLSTFHALGRKIMQECHMPIRLSVLAEDPMKLTQWFNDWFSDFIGSAPENLLKFIQLSYQPVDPFKFESKQEYDQYVTDNEYRTLLGERVKGYQELLIANWLFIHNVPYKYEGRYISKRRIEVGFDYKPDFCLENGIYIEHFGIDRNGNTRPDINAYEYNEQINKKRALHLEHGTTLLETYHYNWVEGDLFDRLETLLHEQGIFTSRKSDEEILEALNNSGIFEESQNRYLKCLQAIRAERLSTQGIYERLKAAKIENIDEYCGILNNIHDSYVQELASNDEIDFDDMILQATQLVESGQFVPKWTHILVDEFQDISMARLALLKALYSKGPRPIWTVVGDDWQSIYRFSGGKLEITTRFNQLVGSHTLSKLEKTYRYNNSIADTAGKFIMQNPEQYKKDIETHTIVDHSCVHLYDSYINSSETNPSQKASEILSEIRQQDPTGSVAILARYNYILKDAREVIRDKNVKFWTFHGSKGLEADYCILIGFFQGKAGFPNENKEEAVVEALLPMLDEYPHSEERRLLYVALTRAKKESFLIADADAPSSFVNELLNPYYDIDIVSTRLQDRYRFIYKCYQCSNGYYVLRNGQFGKYYSCSSGSICPSRPRVCSNCGAPSVDLETESRCRNPDCQKSFPICDICGRPMRLRQGKFGKFWGCSGYGIPNDQCRNTRRFFG